MDKLHVLGLQLEVAALGREPIPKAAAYGIVVACAGEELKAAGFDANQQH